jgi:formiminoglutamase
VRWIDDESMEASARPRDALAEFIADVDHVYLTVCLDVLPAAVAPGVSAPAARGVPLGVVEPLVDVVVASGKLRVADVAEMNPRFDVDGRTAAVAARLVARIANGTARGAVR